ncbi:unnamed protein product, partial [Adineta steineri]
MSSFVQRLLRSLDDNRGRRRDRTGSDVVTSFLIINGEYLRSGDNFDDE